MNICVLGGFGILGSRLSIFLESRGHNVINLGKSEEKIKWTLSNISVNSIINLAALTNVDLCEQKPMQAYQSNVEPLKKILKYVKKETFLIHISTDQVYSGFGPHSENEKASPCNVYGSTKYEAELIARQLNAAILRTNYVAKSFHPEKISFSDWFINSLRLKKNITLFDDIKFNPIHGDFLCEMILNFAESSIKGTYNLGSSECITKANFCIELAKRLNLDLSTIKIGPSPTNSSRALRPKDMHLEIKKIEELGFKMPSIFKTIDLLAKEYT